jgi:hypothetical protein
MNATHIHLLTNHIPIIGIACGFFVLVWSIVSKNKNSLFAALFILLFSGIGGGITNKTGEEAEEQLERMQGISKVAIHEHEEAAEGAMPFILATTVLSAAALYLNYKNHKWSKFSNYALVLAAGLAFIMSARAGFIGGKIRHAAEIEAVQASPAAESEKEEHRD